MIKRCLIRAWELQVPEIVCLVLALLCGIITLKLVLANDSTNDNTIEIFKQLTLGFLVSAPFIASARYVFRETAPGEKKRFIDYIDLESTGAPRAEIRKMLESHSM